MDADYLGVMGRFDESFEHIHVLSSSTRRHR